MHLQQRKVERNTSPLQSSLTHNLIQGGLTYLLTSMILLLGFTLTVLASNATDPNAQVWFKQVTLALTLIIAGVFGVFYRQPVIILIPTLILSAFAATSTNVPLGIHLSLAALVLAQGELKAPQAYGLMLSVLQTCGALMFATIGLAGLTINAVFLLGYLLLTVGLRHWIHPALQDPRLILALSVMALAVSLQ